MKKGKSFTEVFMFILSDAIFLFVLFQISIFSRAHILPIIFNDINSYNPSYDTTVSIIYISFWIMFLLYEGIYTKKIFLWDEVISIWKSSIIVPIFIFFAISIFKISMDISRFVILFTGLLSFFLFPFYKGLIKSLFRKYGVGITPVIIVGAKDGGMSLLNAINKEHLSGYKIVAFVDDIMKGSINGIKIYRRIDKIDRYLKFSGLRDIFIVEADIGKERTYSLINLLQHKAGRLIVIPDFQGLPVIGTEFHYFFYSQMFGIEIKNNLENPINKSIKTLFDIILTIFLLPIFLLLSIFIVIAIVSESKGNPIFTQLRVGKNGKLFKIYKFRTMYIDAEARLKDYFDKNPSARQEYEKYWKLKDDPRVTKVGKFLRKTSIDELPQLINVLKGDMSIVGPRPYLPHELEYVGDSKNTILKVKPGITGLWQISGRSDTDYRYRISLDNWYVRNWSIWIDLIIIFITFRKVIKREGAY